MKKATIFTVIWIILSIIQGCQKKTPTEGLSDPNLFTSYISSFTTGLISTTNSIDIQLTENFQNWKINEEVANDLITIHPKTAGKITYLAGNIVRFTPQQRLESDQTYHITFHLSKVTSISSNTPNKFTFKIATFPLIYTIHALDLQSTDADTYVLNGYVESSDFTTVEEVKNILSANYHNEDIAIQLLQGDNEQTKKTFFRVPAIKRQTKATTLQLKIKKSESLQRTESITKINIPKKGLFDIYKIISTPDEDQSFLINFSEPLKKDQNFTGLVTIGSKNTDNNFPNLSYTADGNILKIYSDKPFTDEIQITIHQGIEDIFKNKTTQNSEHTLDFSIPKPQVELIQSGSILPSSQNLKINFKATSIRAVDVKVYRIYKNNVLQFLQESNYNQDYNLHRVASPIAKKTLHFTNSNTKALLQWNSYALDLASLIEPEPGAIYHIAFSIKKNYSVYPCHEENTITEDNTMTSQSDYYISEEENDIEEEEEEWYYDWENMQDPCYAIYYNYHGKASANIIASDLGVIIKGSSNNIYTAIVNNLITTEPIAGATISYYDFQQQLLKTTTTNNEGISTVYIEKKQPAFAVVEWKKNTTYIKINPAYALSLSTYDIDGSVLEKGINGFIYTERAVWRPGDTIHLGFILDDLTNPLPEDHPIRVSLFDPFGKLTEEKTTLKNKTNHYAFTLSTAPEAITGSWQVIVNVGGVKFYKPLKIETIKPNRLKINSDAEGKTFLNNNKTSRLINFNIQWLQGNNASNLKSQVSLRLLPEETTFPLFKDYVFSNSLFYNKSEEINLYTGNTDTEGNFQVAFPTATMKNASGFQKAILTTKVYEKGGDISTDISQATFSPYSSYVGIKNPTTNKYGYLETGKPLNFSIARANEQGTGSSGTVKVDLYRRTYSWWWGKNNDGLTNYNTSSYHTLFSSTTIQTKNNGIVDYKLTIPEQDWGTYELVITDLESGHIASSIFYVDWPDWSNKAKHTQGKEATSLSIATSKKSYTTKEKVNVSFPSSAGGNALISLENGTNVLKTFWVTTKEGETTFDFEVTEDMAPNVYIHITALQPHLNTVNDLPIRLYGIAMVNIFDKNTKLSPEITMPNVLRPEQEFTVKVTEKNGQKMTYTLAIVEDGLLDLTRFKTPNPWDYFYKKTSLGVKTWDIYDDVIGAYGSSINQVFSIGGDEDLGAGAIKKANRFKPVIIFQGPFTLEAGKTAQHKLQLPKYIGSVRVMLVASNATEKAFGATEKTVKVNSPLMILGSLPRRVVPEEKVTLPVTVFATENSIKKVSIRVKTDNKFKIVSSSVQELNFNAIGEQVAYFDLSVLNQTGISKVTIEATSGNEKAIYEVTLNVVNPNLITTQTESFTLTGKDTKILHWENFGVKGSNSTTLELSSFMPINLNNRLKYLSEFPHGNTEQITSKAFPQLYLKNLININTSQEESIQRNITQAIKKLIERQLPNGGFRYWEGSNYADDWVTTYVGNFLIEAEKQGYVIPAHSLQKWTTYQKSSAKSWTYQPRYANDFAQAYRLYTLALYNQADLASMNRLREINTITSDASLRLAAAYALVGQRDIAATLVSKTINSTQYAKANLYYGSTERNLAMALETMLLTKGYEQKSQEYAEKLTKTLNSNTWMSTQTTSFALKSMAMYFDKYQKGDEINVTIKESNGISNNINTNKLTIYDVKKLQDKNTLNITNLNANTVYGKLSITGKLPVGKEKPFSSKLKLNTIYQLTNGQPIDPKQLKQGTEFIAVIEVTNTSEFPIEDVSLTYLLPSGWENVNLRDSYSDPNITNSDIRDDQAIVYFNLKGKEKKTIKIKLNASYLGTYYHAGIHAEAMYDNSYQVKGEGYWINVIAPEN